MSKILAVLKEGGHDAVRAVEVIGHGAVCVERLLTDGSALEPVTKAAILSIVKTGEAVATSVVAASAGEGANWLADAAAVAAVKEFVAAFIQALPVLKSAATILVQDVTDPVHA